MKKNNIGGINRQNLADSGCDDFLISEFFKNDNPVKRIELLRIQRKRLLDNIHCEQGKLDCLDYLITSIEKQNQRG